MLGLLVTAVSGNFELECAVLNIELGSEQLLEPIQHLGSRAVGEALRSNNNMSSEHRKPRGNRRRVEVMNLQDK